MDSDRLLTDIEAACGAGDWERALTHALAAWRAWPCAGVAELIDAIDSAFIDDGDVVRADGTITATFDSREAKGRARDVRPLLDFIFRRAVRHPAASLLVPKLAERRDRDPRIGAALLALVRRPPYHRRAPDLYGQVFARLVEIADPRAAAEIVALSAPHRGKRTVVPFIGRNGMAALHGAADALARLVPPRPPAGFLDRCGALAARLGARPQPPAALSADDLLAAIYGDPEDLSLRQVYGDALIERGDPRGEFIALQCASASGGPLSARERSLAKSHGRAWLGPIEPHVLIDGLEWAGGFVSSVRAELPNASAEIADLPEWATVACLDLGGWTYAELPLHPNMRVLRSVRGLNRFAVDSIFSHTTPLLWTSLGVQALALVLGRDGPLGRVTTLAADAIGDPGEVKSLFASRLGAQLETLTLCPSRIRWQPIRAHAEPATKLRQLELVGGVERKGLGAWSVTLRRGQDGKLDALAALLRASRHAPTIYNPLIRGLEGLAPDSLSTIELRSMPRARNVESTLLRLREIAAQRFPRAQLL